MKAELDRDTIKHLLNLAIDEKISLEVGDHVFPDDATRLRALGRNDRVIRELREMLVER